MNEIYEVQPDGEKYRNLVSELGWKFELKFMFGKILPEVDEFIFRYQTLEEDIAYEQELVDADDGGDPNKARMRYENGVGDCARVLGFVTGLVLSSAAREQLSEVLNATGQLLPVHVDNDIFYIYNCIRIIDAVDGEKSEIRYVGNRRPSQFTKLVFRNEVVANESLFKTRWPEPNDASNPVDFSKIPPPLTLYATQVFVDMVRKSGLSGFQFKRAGVES